MTEVSSLDSHAPVTRTSDGFVGNSNCLPSANFTYQWIVSLHKVNTGPEHLYTWMAVVAGSSTLQREASTWTERASEDTNLVKSSRLHVCGSKISASHSFTSKISLSGISVQKCACRQGTDMRFVLSHMTIMWHTEVSGCKLSVSVSVATVIRFISRIGAASAGKGTLWHWQKLKNERKNPLWAIHIASHSLVQGLQPLHKTLLHLHKYSTVGIKSLFKFYLKHTIHVPLFSIEVKVSCQEKRHGLSSHPHQATQHHQVRTQTSECMFCPITQKQQLEERWWYHNI